MNALLEGCAISAIAHRLHLNVRDARPRQYPLVRKVGK